MSPFSNCCNPKLKIVLVTSSFIPEKGEKTIVQRIKSVKHGHELINSHLNKYAKMIYTYGGFIGDIERNDNWEIYFSKMEVSMNIDWNSQIWANFDENIIEKRGSILGESKDDEEVQLILDELKEKLVITCKIIVVE